MRKTVFYLSLFLLLISKAFSQEQKILSFDLINGVADTLEIKEFDTLIQKEETSYNTGTYDSCTCILNSTPPTDHVFPNSSFTKKRQASKDYKLNCFPIRTSVKIYKWENDSLKNLCSGVFISGRHVLTAAHCVANFNENSLRSDSLFICPVFDNGEPNPNFECSWVKKVFFFENYNPGQTDFSVLELETPVGKETGWLSIGFDSDETSILDGIFYKFSYPAVTIPALDSNEYNGDTLYYNYGIVDIAHEHKLGISNTVGLPGESGSSLIKVRNEEAYTSYGVLSYSTNLTHNRLTNWKYFALKSIIINDINIGLPEVAPEKNHISIFPNPTSGYLTVSCQDYHALYKIDLFSVNGEKLMEKIFFTKEIRLDLSGLQQGSYLLIVSAGNSRIIKRVIKLKQ